MKAAINKDVSALDQFLTDENHLGRARDILFIIIATVPAILVLLCLAFSARHLPLTLSFMNIISRNGPGLGSDSPMDTVRQLFRSTPRLLFLRDATRRTLFYRMTTLRSLGSGGRHFTNILQYSSAKC